jgi:hypothetical protein
MQTPMGKRPKQRFILAVVENQQARERFLPGALDATNLIRQGQHIP